MVTAVTTNGMPLTSGKALDLVGLVDLVTFSLDGPPEAHALMRGSARAFPGMVEGVAAVRDAGIPFGFLFTLTRRNVADLVWVATFAAEQGAALLQVHPLDLQGRAAVEMQGEDPDVLELAVAQLLSRELGDGEVVVDVMTRQALLARPEVFLADSQVPDGRLGDWLPSLVVRADGLVIPCSHDVDHGFALGCLKVAPLSELAETWLADGGAARFAQASARTYARVTAPGGPALTAWYPELAATTRAWVDTPRCAPAPPPPRWLTLSSQGTRNLGRFQA